MVGAGIFDGDVMLMNRKLEAVPVMTQCPVSDLIFSTIHVDRQGTFIQ